MLREGNALFVHILEEASDAVLHDALRYAGEICAQTRRAYLVLCTDIPWPRLIESSNLDRHREARECSRASRFAHRVLAAAF